MINRSAYLVFLVAFVALPSLTFGKASVERIEGAFPVAIDSRETLMEAVPAIAPDEVAEFFILKGEKLREAMLRWAKTAGYELVWQPKPEDGDVKFASNMSFTGTFEAATTDFFKVVRSQTKFDGKLHSNRVLRVFVANANR